MKDKSIIEKLGITPGPWEMDGERFVYTLNADGVNQFSLTVSPGNWADETVHEAECNARLIAAAPQLLEALIEIADSTYDFCMHPEKYPDHYINEGLDISECDKRSSLNESDFPKYKTIIESATGKSWEEIKKLA